MLHRDMTYPVFLVLGVLAQVAFAAPAPNHREQQVDALLQQFENDTVGFMDRIPQKLRSTGQARSVNRIRFSSADISSRSFVQRKSEARKQLCTQKQGVRVCWGDVLPGRAAIADGDLPELFVDNGSALLRNLEEIDQQGYTEAELQKSPWSDSYWPLNQGILGARYADRRFANSEDWYLNFQSVTGLKTAFSTVLQNLKPLTTNRLSPSEKYDLWVGDPNASLTQAMWNEGKIYYDTQGEVESWMGICHGWASASFMASRPERAVTVTAADGITPIRFYPSDIKALASLLWSRAETFTRHMGGRCNDSNPKKDRNGRIRSQDCFDTNPGSWHLAVVNQIGVSGRSMVIDATYDYEVWNQPVLSYRYSYFNPQTLKSTQSLSRARVQKKAFTKDKFAKYRSKEADSFVGVAMDLTYLTETEPSHALKDSSQQDATETVHYLYDLELDSQGQVIGGEWYENAHPDFVWVPEQDEQALSPGDPLLTESWEGQGALPGRWKTAAIQTSSQGMPLSKLVDVLIRLSRAPQR